MREQKPTIEYRWEAFDPDSGTVVKRGPIRTDLSKAAKYKSEIEVGILNSTLAPYWNGLSLRIVTRTISPWTSMQLQDSETKV